MNDKVISEITRIGSIILTTVLSFVILPPMLNVYDGGVVSWKNIFIFLSGVISILFFRKIEDSQKIKRYVMILLPVFFLLIISYQIMYSKFSLNCENHGRIVVSGEPFKDAKTNDYYRYWKLHCGSPEPKSCLLMAFDCDATNIWKLSDLLPQYYCMLILYLSIIIILTIILTIMCGLISQKPGLNSSIQEKKYHNG